MTETVMVVEDDHAVRSLVRMLLEDDGLTVIEAANGRAAIHAFAQHPVDLVLLDLRLPGMNGFDVCRELRRTSDVPIIMVTAQQDSHDVVAGLEVGADDYVTKPFNDRELLARVRARLRRRAGTITGSVPTAIQVGALDVRPVEGRVLKDGHEVALTKTEFQLLSHLAQHPDRLWSRDQLLDAVWGYAYQGDGRLVDTHVARLRAKVEDDPANPELIQTVRGLGYRLTTGRR
ncbi:MAG: response regulator transcription factor [Acidimicrobiales bacterium]